MADGKRAVVYGLAADDKQNLLWAEAANSFAFLDVGETDVDFLKRVIKDVRGGAPTALEEKYFAEDKDAKKREKLLDALLKDPAVAKKVGDDWKKNMLATPQTTEGTFKYKFDSNLVTPMFNRSWVAPQKFVLPLNSKELKLEGKVVIVPVEPKAFESKLTFPDQKFANPTQLNPPPVTVKPPAVPQPPLTVKLPMTVKPKVPPQPPKPPQPPVEKIDKIVAELIAAKKSDAEILDGITLVVLGRLPSESEKKLALGLVAKAADRKAAWLEVARALASTSEGKERSDALELKDRVKLWSVIDGTPSTLESTVTPAWTTELRGTLEVRPVVPAKK